MLNTLVFLLVLYFGAPIFTLVLIGIAFKDLFEYYSGWLIVAVFGLMMGPMLLLTGAGDDNVPFVSLPEAVAGYHIIGIRTPFVLIAIGVLSLLAKPVYRMLKRST